MKKIEGICLSSSKEFEFDRVKSYISELSPKTKIYDFNEVLENKSILKKCDFMFPIGGDGSVAWLVRTFYKKWGDHKLLKPIVPVIRKESVGYLKQLDMDEVKFKRGFKRLLKGDYMINPRTILKMNINGKNYLSVNELNIRCSPHMGMFTVYLQNKNKYHQFTKTFADGIILSTGIGSTGWALSYGGEISLSEDVIQLIFVGGLSNSKNFILPRKNIKINVELKNSPITDDIVELYNEQRMELGLPPDDDPVKVLEIVYGLRIIVDGKLIAYGVNNLDVITSESIPFVNLAKEMTWDKARKLTKQTIAK